MKYNAPKQGHYESGLTAKLMYSIVDGLIKKHTTREDIERLKGNGLGTGKCWDVPQIRGELEEFVDSYFLSDFEEPHLSFGRLVLEKDKKAREKKVDDYAAQLEQQYGPTEANRQISLAVSKIKSRCGKIFAEVSKLKKLKKVNPLIRNNAGDGFSHILTPYFRIEMIRDYLQMPT